MDKPAPNAKPPLLVWLFLGLTLAGLLAWLYSEDKKTARVASEDLTRVLLDRSAQAGSKPLVLVIGTSLVQAGLDSTDRICRCVEERTGTKIVLLKCWMSGGDLAKMSRNQESLFRQLKPSVVLIESNLLFYRPAGTSLPSLFAQTFRDLVRGWRRPGYDPDRREEKRPTDRAAIENARSGLVDTADLEGFRGICAGWQRSGARIGLLNIPLEKTLEYNKWHSADTAGFVSNLRYLKKTGPVASYDSGLQLDSTYFFDFGHLNRKGDDAFSPWFCQLLSEETRQSSGSKKSPGR